MFTPIKLDKMRNIRFGMRANQLIERTLGIKSFLNLDLDNLSTDEIATLLWAGLVHEDSELTPDKVIDLVDEFSTQSIVYPIIAKAYIDSIVEGTEEKKSGKQKKTTISE